MAYLSTSIRCIKIHNNRINFIALLYIIVLGGCEGDSGGPLWVTTEQGSVLVGIYSGQWKYNHHHQPNCPETGTGTKINKEMSDWINLWME